MIDTLSSTNHSNTFSFNLIFNSNTQVFDESNETCIVKQVKDSIINLIKNEGVNKFLERLQIISSGEIFDLSVQKSCQKCGEEHIRDEARIPLDKRFKSGKFENIPDLFNKLFKDEEIKKEKKIQIIPEEEHLNAEEGKLNLMQLKQDLQMNQEEENYFHQPDRKESFASSKKKHKHSKKEDVEFLLCDKFKSSYESTLLLKPRPNQDLNQNDVTIISNYKLGGGSGKNYRLTLLYANMSYSMGLYSKAMDFYLTALEMMSKGSNTEFPYEQVLHTALLQNNIARCLTSSLRVREGIEYLEKASKTIVNVKKQNLECEKLKFYVEFNLAESYYLIQNYESAVRVLEYIHESLESINCQLQENEKNEMFYKYYFNLGKVYLRIQCYDHTIELFKVANEILKSNKNIFISQNCNLISAELFQYFSMVYLKTKDMNKALEYIIKSHDIYSRFYSEDNTTLIISTINLANVYIQIKQAGKAVQLVTNAIEVCKNIDDTDIYSYMLYRNLGNCFFTTGNDKKGLSNLTESNNYFRKFLTINKLDTPPSNALLQNMYGVLEI
jgi:tetratricopeptide (TPR) repeat protein